MNLPWLTLQTCMLSILAGFVVGIVFAALKLPSPSPPAIAGILGIFGVYLGGHTWVYIMSKFLQ